MSGEAKEPGSTFMLNIPSVRFKYTHRAFTHFSVNRHLVVM